MKPLQTILIILGSLGFLAGAYYLGFTAGYNACKKKVLTKANDYWSRKDDEDL